MKAKGNNDHIIEKFSAYSSKSAKYAKTIIKKKDANDNTSTTNNAVTKSGTNNTANATSNTNDTKKTDAHDENNPTT